MTLVVMCWGCASEKRMPLEGLPIGWRRVSTSNGDEYLCPECMALPKKILR